MHDSIVIKGAREHNLKNIDLILPKNKLITITGLSGSGKSTLAFDTIYAEGQRRYVESLSAYARQFLGLMNKPDVDSIEGLSPAISIEQKTTSRNPRSTVGTVTEIYDYLRLLFARVGTPHCPICGKEIVPQSAEQITNRIMEHDAARVMIFAPVVRGRKGTYEQLFKDLQQQGYTRAEVDGSLYRLDDVPDLERYVKHDINVLIDRVSLKGKKNELRTRLNEAIEAGLDMADGLLLAQYDESDEKQVFSRTNSCPDHNIAFEELQPRMFSFNSPFGACPDCHGLGFKQAFDPDLLIPDPSRSLMEGAVDVWKGRLDTWRVRYMVRFAQKHGIDPYTPWEELEEHERRLLLYGEDTGDKTFDGIIPTLDRLYKQTDSDRMRSYYERYVTPHSCETCAGNRLKPESLSVLIDGKNIIQVTDLSIRDCAMFFQRLALTQQQKEIAHMVLKEIRDRLSFLVNVGLGYLTLSRSAGTLSGGEAQRIRLATQIGSNLTGVIYVLDEPSIGLHQRDNHRLISTLKHLRDLGNTLIVVEHDEETMLESDVLLDMGPGAGIHGGHIVAQQEPRAMMKNKGSITGQYLAGKKTIAMPTARRDPKGWITVKGAEENNLKKVDVAFPLGVLCLVTGVSGSGKSTLVNQTLVTALHNHFYRTHQKVGKHSEIAGKDEVDKIIVIDQSPIGRTPRSNPATYTKVFTDIRELFANTKEAKIRGYAPGRFSFNVKGGRCETCQGDGVIKIEMNFLPDVYVTCEECKGKRYNAETLQITYKEKTIADVLDMTVEEAYGFFASVPRIERRLRMLNDVGLGYIKLGQSATTLSGGEAQRVKLTSELAKRGTGNTLYVLDEPTTGLHFDDVSKLLDVLQRLVKRGNTVVVIEHNLDVVKSADYIIDLGPEGGDEGGKVIATGTPEEIVKVKESHTGQYLKPVIGKARGSKKTK
ncbi:MAG: excinuclease ABC subunit UvrA [Nanoarchaeota archaeon]